MSHSQLENMPCSQSGSDSDGWQTFPLAGRSVGMPLSAGVVSVGEMGVSVGGVPSS